MTSLRPGQSPPQVTIPAVVRLGSKKMCSRGPATSRLLGVSPLETAFLKLSRESSKRMRSESVRKCTGNPPRLASGERISHFPSEAMLVSMAGVYIRGFTRDANGFKPNAEVEGGKENTYSENSAQGKGRKGPKGTERTEGTAELERNLLMRRGRKPMGTRFWSSFPSLTWERKCFRSCTSVPVPLLTSVTATGVQRGGSATEALGRVGGDALAKWNFPDQCVPKSNLGTRARVACRSPSRVPKAPSSSWRCAVPCAKFSSTCSSSF